MADTKFLHQNKPNPTKFYSHFLYKALVATIFLVILPIFPSQAPDFINQTLNTKGWELLHLIFVGIAVSYGLFSHRNDESEKDNTPSKFDNAQSYVSKFLQVSSIFDDEVNSPGPGPSGSDGVPTVQTWNNQYYRNEPVVVVADQNSVLHQDQKKISDTRVGGKPLLLPVRSLKSRVFDADAVEESFNSLSRSNSSLNSKQFSGNLEENLKNNVVLPSPIPWRSRSGRIDFKETKQEQPKSPTLHSPPSSSMEESEFNRSLKAQTSRVSRSDSSTSSPKLSSSPNKFSIETQGKSAEDFVRKKSIYRSPPPPPPPPPTPPHLIRKSKSTTPIDDEIFSPRRSFTSEPKSARPSRINGFDQSSMKTENQNRDRASFMAQATVMEFPEEEKEVEKLVLESEEDLETEDEEDYEIETDAFVTMPSGGLGGGSSSGDSGPDVDKKADEFIAKFREQIRRQRIESIKRSSGQINRKIKR